MNNEVIIYKDVELKLPIEITFLQKFHQTFFKSKIYNK